MPYLRLQPCACACAAAPVAAVPVITASLPCRPITKTHAESKDKRHNSGTFAVSDHPDINLSFHYKLFLIDSIPSFFTSSFAGHQYRFQRQDVNGNHLPKDPVTVRRANSHSC